MSNSDQTAIRLLGVLAFLLCSCANKDQTVAKYPAAASPVVRAPAERKHSKKEGPMRATRSTFIFSIAAFLLGFALGGLSFHVAPAEGVFGLKTAMTQIGTALVEMQKNVDDLQKNMGTIKQAKDQLSSLSPASGDATKKESDSVKPTIPGIGP